MAQLASNQCTDQGPTRSGVSAFVNASPSQAKGPSAHRPSAGSAAIAAPHPPSKRTRATRADAPIFTERSFPSLTLAAPTPSRVQYGNDIDKLLTHTMNHNIRKSRHDQDPRASNDTGRADQGNRESLPTLCAIRATVLLAAAGSSFAMWP